MSDTPNTHAIAAQAAPWVEAPRPAFVRPAEPRPDAAKLAEGAVLLREAHVAAGRMHAAFDAGRDDEAVLYAHAANRLLDKAKAAHDDAMRGYVTNRTAGL